RTHEGATRTGAGTHEGATRTVRRTHERRPEGRRSICVTTTQGDRLNGHLLRGGAARTIYHCTSPPFVRENGTRTAEVMQQGEPAPPPASAPPAPSAIVR